MADQYYYTQQGQQLGPVALEQLQTMIASGELQATDLVWHEGMGDWTAVEGVPELAASLPEVAESAAPDMPPPLPAACPPSRRPPVAGGYGGSPGQDFFKKLGLEGILVASGALGMLIACVLPWHSVDVFIASASLIGFQVAPGILSFLCAVGAGVCVGIYNFVPNLKGSKQNAMIYAIVFTATGGLAVLMAFISFFRGGVSIGVFLAFLAAGAILAGGIISIVNASKMPADAPRY